MSFPEKNGKKGLLRRSPFLTFLNDTCEAILDVTATIYCERESHKGILIGKGGSMLRKIGQEARADLEDFFQIKVNLQCWVKVKEGWRNREGMIKNFGLE